VERRVQEKEKKGEGAKRNKKNEQEQVRRRKKCEKEEVGSYEGRARKNDKIVMEKEAISRRKRRKEAEEGT
jgi:hypothetical protein